MKRTLTISTIVAALILIGAGSYWLVTYFTKKQVPPDTHESTVNYIFLTNAESGNATAVSIPSELVIQLKNTTTASSTSIYDPDNVLREPKIESYNQAVIISGTITKPGKIEIKTESSELSYSFLQSGT